MIRQNYKLVILNHGCEYYYYKNKPHRLNGPAISLFRDGIGGKLYSVHQYYYVNGKRHRLDGPTMIWDDVIYYYVNNSQISIHDFYDNYYQEQND